MHSRASAQQKPWEERWSLSACACAGRQSSTEELQNATEEMKASSHMFNKQVNIEPARLARVRHSGCVQSL